MFGRKQAAEVIKDIDLKPEVLVERIKYAITSDTLIESMKNAAHSFAKFQATQEIAAEIVKLAKVK